jgi:cyclophilin family peptidyl-prolyl cis-trans isomerase
MLNLMSTLVLAATGVMLAFSGTLFAAETADTEEWNTIFGRKKAILEELAELQKKYQQSPPDAQKQLAAQFEKVRDELQNDVFPKLAELAPKIYAADPDNLDAAETAMEAAFQTNRYDDSAKLAQELFGKGRKTMLVRNILGVSLFAQHEFEKAGKVLEAAKQGGVLHPRLGGQYIDVIPKYQQLWETEQAVRAKESAAEPGQELPQVRFKTNRGDIVIELFENEAPNTVANFISLVENKVYDGVKFHRVIPQFMAQGGDPLSKDEDPSNDGTGGPGYEIDCECFGENARQHFRGSLSMAHAGKNTGGSQFFITHLPTPHLNPNPQRQTGHTVFGRVAEGLDVAAALEIGDTIESATVIRKRDHEYKPVTHAASR